MQKQQQKKVRVEARLTERIESHLHRDEYIDALSILFYYVISKCNHHLGGEVFDELGSRCGELVRYLKQMEAQCGTLFDVLSSRLELTERDMSRMHHLKAIIELTRELGSRDNVFTPRNLYGIVYERDEFDMQLHGELMRCDKLLAYIIALRRNLESASIEATDYAQCLHRIADAMERLEDQVMRRMDESIEQAHGAAELYPLALLHKLIAITREAWTAAAEGRRIAKRHQPLLLSIDYARELRLN